MSNSLKKMSKLNNKLTNSFNSKINSATKNYNKIFTKNDYVNHGISLLIVVLILCIQVIPNNVLSFLNNAVVRLVLILLICVLCLVDPIKALLFAIAFVVAVQKLHKTDESNVVNINEINEINKLENDFNTNSINSINSNEASNNNVEVAKNVAQLNNKINNTLNNALDNNLNNVVNDLLKRTGAKAPVNVVKEAVKNSVNNVVNTVLNNSVSNIANEHGNLVDITVIKDVLNNSVNDVVNNTVNNAINKLNKNQDNQVDVASVKNAVKNSVKNSINNVVNHAVNVAANNVVVNNVVSNNIAQSNNVALDAANQQSKNIVDYDLNSNTKINPANTVVGDVNIVNHLGNNINSLNNLESNNNASLLSDIKDDAINVDNRNCRKNLNAEGDNAGTLVKNKISMNNNLLLGDVPGYKPVNRNNLKGEYRNNVLASNNNELLIKNLYSNPGNNRGNMRGPNYKATNNVPGFNGNNLVTKNPFPGNNSPYKPKFVPASNNVNSYNNSDKGYGSVNNVGNLLIEGFTNPPATINSNNSLVVNSNDNGNFSVLPNEPNDFGNNLISNGPNRNVKLNVPVNVQNNPNANLVGSEAGNTNNIVNGPNRNVNVKAPYNPSNNVANTGSPLLNDNECVSLFPNHVENQLRRAQERGVPNPENKKAVRSAENMHSAQGYRVGGQVSGYNESGSNSINYLCV